MDGGERERNAYCPIFIFIFFASSSFLGTDIPEKGGLGYDDDDDDLCWDEFLIG